MSRARQVLRAARSRSTRPHFRLYQGDLTRTKFRDRRFDVGVCLSVIEHGVPLPAFFAEARRILKPGAPLFISTDYWDPQIPQPPNAAADGLPWKISARRDIEQLLEFAKSAGFSLKQPASVPNCSERTVTWSGQSYTFIVVTLQRE